MKRFVAILLATLLLVQSSVLAMTPGGIESGVNGVRAERGLAPLNDNASLNRSAAVKAADLCAKNYWAHGNWASFIIGAGYNGYANIGENLAYSWVDGHEERVITSWVNSPGHMANIVGNYNEQGAAVLRCPNYQGQASTTIMVNHFGLRYPKPVVNKMPPAVDKQPADVNKTETPTLPKIAESGEVKPAPHHERTSDEEFRDLLLALLTKGWCGPSVWHGVDKQCLKI